jgi:type I restriction enzyme S subunit
MWKTVKLGDVLKTGAGGTPLKSKKEFYEGGAIKWLLSGAVCERDIKDSKTFITEVGLANSSAKLFPQNTVLVAMYGATAGQVGILRTEAATNQAVCGIYPSEDYLEEFLYYYLTSYKETLLLEVSGVAQPNLSQVKIKHIPLPLLPLAEQQRIVAKLDAAFVEIDTAIAAAEKSEEKLREQQTLYTEFIFNETCSPFKKIDLGDVCDGVEYGTSSKCSKVGKHPVLRMGNIQDGAFDVSDLVYLDDENEAEKYKLSRGDVLFNRTNSSVHVGKVGMFDEVDDYLFAGYLIRVNYLKEKILPQFLTYYLNSSKIRNYGFSVMSESINQSNINGSKLKKYPFYEVPLEAQEFATQKIVAVNSASDEAINLYRKKAEALKQLKFSLLAAELTNMSEAA